MVGLHPNVAETYRSPRRRPTGVLPGGGERPVTPREALSSAACLARLDAGRQGLFPSFFESREVSLKILPGPAPSISVAISRSTWARHALARIPIPLPRAARPLPTRARAPSGRSPSPEAKAPPRELS